MIRFAAEYGMLFVVILTFFSGIGQKTGEIFKVHEIPFKGRHYGIGDNPVRDITLVTEWRHETTKWPIKVYGYFDGDGNGGIEGNVFKVRFCPTGIGEWTLESVISNDSTLHGQNEGLKLWATTSEHPGFWISDSKSAGNRWYRRTNGTHPYIVGNTMYTFVSGHDGIRAKAKGIKEDILANAPYFNKIRFAVTGDLFPHPSDKPFLDHSGKPTDDGNYSHRPNPEWFSNRIDLAVQTMYGKDIIADMILNGPDSYHGRSLLKPKQNAGDPTPFLRYIAARYGSYPNVWICLSNEYDIREPNYSPEEIKKLGFIMKEMLTYDTPLSVHRDQQKWHPDLNSIYDWNDHIIFQNKIKYLAMSADKMDLNYWIGQRKPIFNDELAYEGKGDGWLEEDVLEAFLGAFLGGGYASTGYKSALKRGHYFSGDFNASEHSAADNLQWFRQIIDENVNFWEMEPFTTLFTWDWGLQMDIFSNISYDTRLLANRGNEYAIGFNTEHKDIKVDLPPGYWRVVLYDIVGKVQTELGNDVSGKFSFDIPDSRASMVHLKRNR